jgi:hypothetical protein
MMRSAAAAAVATVPSPLTLTAFPPVMAAEAVQVIASPGKYSGT